MAFNTEQILLFLSVLDQGSFSAAARKLGRVPSAVSMAIAQLEAELDLPLFERVGREPVPTAAARALEPQARALAEQLQRLNVQALALTQGLEDRLTLAIAPELLAGPWSVPLAALAQEHPLLQVEVLAAPQTDALAMLHSGRAQLALVFERPNIDGREGFQEVGRESLVAVAAAQHPMLQHPPVRSKSGRASQPRVTLEQLTTTRQIVVASRDGENPEARFLFSQQHWRTDTHTAALQLIEAGLGWGWQPQALVAAHIASGSLVKLDIDNLSNQTALFVDVVWSKERPLGLGAQFFVRQMQAQAEHSPG